MTALSRRLCVAPMMDWTDRHCRFFLRLISARALLYTEMVTSAAIIHGDRDRLLGFDRAEHPVAVQLGGSDPKELAAAARIAADYGYDEINLNVGCPSDRVQSGRFGACLMREPDLVAECVDAMRSAVDLSVTVKSRIGVDDQHPEDILPAFVETVRQAGCSTFIVHARKALLQGLSPKDNRTVPPLNYPLVYRLKADNPDLEIIINGGILDLDASMEHLAHVDGVMLGRAAYQTPYILAEADCRLYGETTGPRNRVEVIEAMRPYIADHLSRGGRLADITRHILGVFHGQPGGRIWRRVLSERAPKPGAGLEVIDEALAQMQAVPVRAVPEPLAAEA